MIFTELDKLKRRIVMSSIILMAAGILLLILPSENIEPAGMISGFALLVFAAVTVFRFIDRPKILLRYIELGVGLAAGLLGFALCSYKGVFLTLLSALVGTVPILSGGVGIFHALTFARRSGKKSWWILLLLSAAMVGFGAFVFCNPWMESDRGLMQVAGGSLMCSSLVSAVRLIWTFPANRAGR